MELAHQAGLKVLLDGQGGDETLAGYCALPAACGCAICSPPAISAASSRLFGPVGETRSAPHHALALTLEPWLPGALFAPLRRRFGQGKDRVLADGLRRLAAPEPPRAPRSFGSALANQQAFDLTQRLLPSLLRYEDRNSMAFSIETRLPFLDYRLVEFAFSLPDEQRLDGDVTKAILRRALADRVPAAILARRDKMGFETPTDPWLRGRFSAEVQAGACSATDRCTRGSKPEALRAELDATCSGSATIGLQVWRWLSLDAWARRYLSGDPRVIERAARGAFCTPVVIAPTSRSRANCARETAGSAVARFAEWTWSFSPRCAGDTSARGSSSCCRASREPWRMFFAQPAAFVERRSVDARGTRATSPTSRCRSSSPRRASRSTTP